MSRSNGKKYATESNQQATVGSTATITRSRSRMDISCIVFFFNFYWLGWNIVCNKKGSRQRTVVKGGGDDQERSKILGYIVVDMWLMYI